MICPVDPAHATPLETKGEEPIFWPPHVFILFPVSACVLRLAAKIGLDRRDVNRIYLLFYGLGPTGTGTT